MSYYILCSTRCTSSTNRSDSSRMWKPSCQHYLGSTSIRWQQPYCALPSALQPNTRYLFLN